MLSPGSIARLISMMYAVRPVALGQLFRPDDGVHMSVLPAGPTGTIAEEAVDDDRDLPFHECEDVAQSSSRRRDSGGRSAVASRPFGDLMEPAVNASGLPEE